MCSRKGINDILPCSGVCPPRKQCRNTGRWEGAETGQATARVASSPPGTVQKGASESTGCLCHFWHPLRNKCQPFYNNQGLHIASPAIFSCCQYSGSDTHPSSSAPQGIPVLMPPFPLPNCSSFLLLPILSSTQRRKKDGKDQSNCISVTTNKREAPNCPRLSHECQKFCIIYKNKLCYIFN